MVRFDDVACTACGCVCDDISVHVDQGRLIATERACSLGERWFAQLGDDARPLAALHGSPASFEEGLDAAAQSLRGARAPLVYGLARSSTSGQRAAVRLADRLGAVIDTTASTCHAPSIMAVQSVGESTCTLGEVRNRSELVIYWGSDPLTSHPRHMERFVDAPGLLAPSGRFDRHVVVVDVVPTRSSERADRFVRVSPNGDFELIWALRAELRRQPWLGDGAGGAPRDQIVALASALKSCRYGAVFFGLGLTRGVAPHGTIEALLRLVTELNEHTRFVARRMRIPGDVSGADSVLCWQTGFPFAINLARGYPRYNPGEYSADALLAQGEVDAVLFVGSEGAAKLSLAAQRRLGEIPVIALDNPGQTYEGRCDVRFTTAAYGLHCPGTAYRMDEVPIPLRSLAASRFPDDAEVLNGLLQKLAPNA